MSPLSLRCCRSLPPRRKTPKVPTASATIQTKERRVQFPVVAPKRSASGGTTNATRPCDHPGAECGRGQSSEPMRVAKSRPSRASTGRSSRRGPRGLRLGRYLELSASQRFRAHTGRKASSLGNNRALPAVLSEARKTRTRTPGICRFAMAPRQPARLPRPCVPLPCCSVPRWSACIASAALLARSLRAWLMRTAAPESPRRIMPLSEIRPGVKGYGLTVFSGTKLERFVTSK